MAGLSEIEWTDATWNPVTGCLMISPGCTHCYAMRMAGRLQSMNHPSYIGVTRKSGSRRVWTGKVNTIESALTIPLRWKRPRRIFVNSMSDLFQEDVPLEFTAAVWAVMAEARQHTFQILTKRPQIMRQRVIEGRLSTLPNVWLGTSVESPSYCDRIAELRRTPASVRFVSFEPLLERIGKVDLSDIDWAIVGGESGPDARPMCESWVDEIRRQCRIFDTAFFFKQWGGTNKKIAGRKYRGRTWDEFPLP